MSPHIKSDTNWQLSVNANPMRGYHDYERRIVFKPGTSIEDQSAVIREIMAEYYKLAESGWYWASEKYIPAQDRGLEGTFVLRQGYDSSG